MTKLVLRLFPIIFCFALNTFSQTNDLYTVFYLRETNNDLKLEYIQLKEGETKTFDQDKIVSIILPLSPGKSGDIIFKEKRKGKLLIHCENNEIKVSILAPDNSQRDLPLIDKENIDKYSIRVNVTSVNNFRKAFYINGIADYGVASGPVLDMFGGKIPLQEGDFSITTEVKQKEKSDFVFGRADVELYNNLLFVNGKIQNGSNGYFIIDFGAGSTVILRDALPENISIDKVLSISYSEEGEKTSEGTVGGAGGDVPGFLGNAILEKIKIGEITFKNVSSRVVEKFPAFGDKHIIGIIGMDLLMRAPFVSINYNHGEKASIEMLAEMPENKNSKQFLIPFSLIGKQIFIEGTVNNSPITFLFDTGARGSIISADYNLSGSFEINKNKGREFKGLDENPIAAKSVTVKQFSLNNNSFPFYDFYIAKLPVLEGLGLQDRSGLLGNDFYLQFKNLIIDYNSKTIHFIQ